MGEVHGHCDERFEPLAAWLRSNQEQGIDEGASLAVEFGGELVVDLWSGTTDRQRSRKWQRDTLVHVFSTSKVMTFITTLVAADRGLVDIEAPVAEYWPEFAANGKGGVTVRHVMLHQSGVPGYGRPMSWAEVGDWEFAVGVLAASELWHEPGAKSYYHPYTQGHMLGEVVRRATGRPFDEFFRTELAEPLGADFHFSGAEPAVADRVARLWYPTDPPDEMADPVMVEVEPVDISSRRHMDAVIPSTSGIGNGRSIARIGSVIALRGEVDGRRYLSPELVDEACREQSFLDDHLLGPLRIGLGFGLDHWYYAAPTPTSVAWGGFGGSYVCMDPTIGLSVGYAPNGLRYDTDPDHPRFSNGRLATLIATIGEVSGTLGGTT